MKLYPVDQWRHMEIFGQCSAKIGENVVSPAPAALTNERGKAARLTIVLHLCYNCVTIVLQLCYMRTAENVRR